MRPLLLLDALKALGVGQQVLLALSAGFVVWYVYKAMGIGRLIGGLVGQTVRYALAVGTFVALGIGLGWTNPFVMLADLGTAANELGGFLGRFGDDAWRLLQGVLGG